MSEEPEFDPRVFLAVANPVRTYTAGETIYAQGDPARAVFYVHSGEIKVVVTFVQGKEAVVGILKAGEFLGEGTAPERALRALRACFCASGLILDARSRSGLRGQNPDVRCKPGCKLPFPPQVNAPGSPCCAWV
jgi:hypothetical protein